MGQLQQMVKSSLEAKNVGPQVLVQLDTWIYRAVMNLQRDDFLPPRTLEFKSGDKRQERRDTDDEILFEYYYLPDDFRKLEEFYVKESTDNDRHIPYVYEKDANKLYQYYEDSIDKDTLPHKFTITDNNLNDNTKYDKLLIAYPFPEDDTFIRVTYYVDGTSGNYEWIDPEYYEAVIAQVEFLLDIGSPQRAEQESANATTQWRERKGQNEYNETTSNIKGSYFGKR